jgi:cytosine/adenosine deaminase-related metal-dependent hydrolase
MSRTTLIRGGLVLDWLPYGVDYADLLVHDGRIAERGPTLPARDAEVVEAEGALVMPGWVIAHHHLYSALAKGMPQPPWPPKSFHEILKRVWWVLDRCLDLEGVRHSALVGGLDALLAGTTFIVDHHASPSAVRGSLSALGEELTALGVRSCLAYEVSDRDGEVSRDEGLAENREYRGLDGWSWPFPGGHASFTLADDTLAALAEHGRLHVHLLEDPCDDALSRERYGASPVERFDRAGLVGPGSLFGHGIHLSDADFALLVERGARLAYNPRSNANNGVGVRTLEQYAPIGCLGTDGMDGDLFAELKFAYFRARDHGVADAMTPLVTMLQNNYRLARDLSGLALGALEPGAPADLMVVAPHSPTPLQPSNVLGHLVFALSRHHVRDVMVDGAWRVRDRRATAPGADRIPQEARPVATELWRRMEALWALEGEHPF